MTLSFAEYIEAGHELTPDERLQAARMLRLSVDQDTDSDQADFDVAWNDVIDRRRINGVSMKQPTPGSVRLCCSSRTNDRVEPAALHAQR